MDQRHAKLRICASCEWIFHIDDQHPEMGGCPKCGFAHYGARFVYGDKVYTYRYTQKPWLDKKIEEYMRELKKQLPKKPRRKKYESILDLASLRVLNNW